MRWDETRQSVADADAERCSWGRVGFAYGLFCCCWDCWFVWVSEKLAAVLFSVDGSMDVLVLVLVLVLVCVMCWCWVNAWFVVNVCWFVCVIVFREAFCDLWFVLCALRSYRRRRRRPAGGEKCEDFRLRKARDAMQTNEIISLHWSLHNSTTSRHSYIDLCTTLLR
jgi:hypothetical protein